MKETKKIFNTLTIGHIILDAILILLSLYYASDPETSTNAIGHVFGLLFIVFGIYDILKYVLNMDKKGFIIVEIFHGLLNIVVGVITVFNPFSIASIITIGLGLWLIVSALFKAVVAIQFQRYREETWLLNLVIAVLTLTIGIIIILKPFDSYLAISTFVGILITCYCGMDIVQQLLFRKRAKEVLKIFFE